LATKVLIIYLYFTLGLVRESNEIKENEIAKREGKITNDKILFICHML
jgi:hypothetical protein